MDPLFRGLSGITLYFLVDIYIIILLFLSCVCSICALSSIAIVLSPAFAHLVIILFFVIVSLLEPNYIVCVKYFFRIKIVIFFIISTFVAYFIFGTAQLKAWSRIVTIRG